ncbi:MAG: MATE family efflux transporter [bacterium]
MNNDTNITNFNFWRVLKLVAPTISMMSFLSLYTVIDGTFIANFVGTDALSSSNIAFPFVNFLLGISIMLGSGGCAFVMKKVGEDKLEEARKAFSTIVLFAIAIGVVIMVVSSIFLDDIIIMLGATENLHQYCKDYLFFFIVFTIPTILKFIMEQFLVAINKSGIALILTILGGILNILLDYIFIYLMGYGIEGASFATGLGYTIPSIIGIIIFMNKKHMLHFVNPFSSSGSGSDNNNSSNADTNIQTILKTCSNGSSEMITQLSNGLITFLYNYIMLKYLGEDGVASITIILYIQFLVSSIFMGYSVGIAPQISFFYGNKDTQILKKIISISFIFITLSSLIMYGLSIVLADILVGWFAEPNTGVFDITLDGLKKYSLAFLFMGFPIFISAMFTAFSNGKVSAFISFSKTLIFQSIGIISFPFLFGATSVWYAVLMAQILGCMLCLYFYKKYKAIYQY